MFVDPFAVSAALHIGHPIGVGQIPFHGFADAGVKGLGRLPAKFRFKLAGIYRITAVVAWAVGHVADLLGVGFAVGARAQFVQQRAHRFDDLDIGLFVPAAHIVDLTQSPGFKHTADRTAMVLDVQPVAHLHSVAVHRQGLARQRVDDHQRDEFFGKVVGAVVVAAIGGQHRQAVGVLPSAHQVVAGGFARTVGAVGLVTVGFGESGVVFAQRAIDLVGGNVQKAKRSFVGIQQCTPIAADRLQQTEGAHNVGLDEITGVVNRAVHMAFSGKIDHGTGPVLGQQAADKGCIAYVTLHQLVACIT